jgi:hypothetical protein
MNDPIHQQWYEMSKPTGLAARQDQRNLARFVVGTLAITGYTYHEGGEAIAQVANGCREYYNSGDGTAFEKCLGGALKYGAAYVFIGTVAATGDRAAVSTLKGLTGLGNIVFNDQGQGASSKRDDNPIDVKHFVYGDGNLTNHEIDYMNHAVDLAIADRTNNVQPFVRQPHSKRNCFVQPQNLYTNDHYFTFANIDGVKVECKNGCGYASYDSNDLAGVLTFWMARAVATKDLLSQFTMYDERSGNIFARCKTVINTQDADTCPEPIDGQGCRF